jgi:hypothetical protein
MAIGRFRTAEKTPYGVVFKMYGRPIFTIDNDRKTVKLDLCGYWTSAVVKAMREYGEAIGIDIKPSLAKGKFTALYNGTIHEASFDNSITIEV